MELLIIYLTIIAVGFFVTEFEPLHYLVDAVKEKADNKVVDFFMDMFSCWKCTTFWTGLIITQDFYTACIATLGTVIIDRWLEK